MEVKDVVYTAKAYIADLLREEGVQNVGLEEIEYDDSEGVWNVTVGFSRPWNMSRNALTALTGEVASQRTYRIVKVRGADGRILSIKRRETTE